MVYCFWTVGKVSLKFKFRFRHIHSRKCLWKCRLQTCGHFVSASMCLYMDMFLQHHLQPLIPWWRHQMEKLSALLALCEGNSSVNSPHKGQWRGALMFSLLCVWTNGWANNGDAGDLRCHRAHYDLAVMPQRLFNTQPGQHGHQTIFFIDLD